VALAHIVVLSSALVTLLGIPCAVTAVRRADDLARRRLWARRCEADNRALRDLDRALQGVDPSEIIAALRGPSIDQIENDLRRLNHVRRTSQAVESRSWRDAVDRAYDLRLCLACECLGLAAHLGPLDGMDRELERLRVEEELRAAGLTLHS
jgi:hypothetical protein